MTTDTTMQVYQITIKASPERIWEWPSLYDEDTRPASSRAGSPGRLNYIGDGQCRVTVMHDRLEGAPRTADNVRGSGMDRRHHPPEAGARNGLTCANATAGRSIGRELAGNIARNGLPGQTEKLQRYDESYHYPTRDAVRPVWTWLRVTERNGISFFHAVEG